VRPRRLPSSGEGGASLAPRRRLTIRTMPPKTWRPWRADGVIHSDVVPSLMEQVAWRAGWSFGLVCCGFLRYRAGSESKERTVVKMRESFSL